MNVFEGRQEAPQIKRYWLHQCCAYPTTICWIIGTTILWLLLTVKLSEHHVFGHCLSQWAIFWRLVVCYAAVSGLGFFAGAWGLQWLVVPFCERTNGAPHNLGEKVLILCGRFKGTVSFIREISTGQGGWPVLHVELGEDAREKYQDLFGSEALLRLLPKCIANQCSPKTMRVEEKRDGEPLWEEVFFYRCVMHPHLDGDLINIWTTIRPLQDRATTEEHVRQCAKRMAEWIMSNSSSFSPKDSFQVFIGWTLDVRATARQIIKTGGDWNAIAELSAHPEALEFRRNWDAGIFPS